MQASHEASDESHTVFEVPSLVQKVPDDCGHVVLGHEGALLHLTSHAHACMQLTAPHDDMPAQSILHSPAPQAMAPHEDTPEQLISQAVPRVQSMLAQAFALSHSIVQSKPGGHWTAPHALAELHSILQVLSVRLQDVHWPGHALRTQYPRSQVRLFSQSASVLQV
jgi:hypothetical protein